MNTDVLIIGSGIAGLSYAIQLASQSEHIKIIIISKRDLMETNTRYAQGGIAVVSNFIKDSFDKHVQDTQKAGDYICDEQVVDFVVKEGPERLKDLIAWGTRFDTKDKTLHLGREGGHSAERIVHYKDQSGLQIQEALIHKAKSFKNISFLENHILVDLITDHHLGSKHYQRCYGAYVISKIDKEIIHIVARITVLSTGGAGQVYAHTTNPEAATGDGLGAAYRAKVKIKHLQFVQFHPTALYPKIKGNTFLITEAVRGQGAVLRTLSGKAFMSSYDEREDLASRDIVARAIVNEMKKNNDQFVLLDCSSIDPSKFKQLFPTILTTCRSVGVQPLKEPIPVVPAAHYFCGGIEVDHYAQTSLSGLYAIGECSHTGLHGANRLASNSLLEALVFAQRAAQSSIKSLNSLNISDDFFDQIPKWKGLKVTMEEDDPDVFKIKSELQILMSRYVGILNSNAGLSKAELNLQHLFERTQILYQNNKLTPQLASLRNLVSVAYLIVKQSQEYPENKGVFFNKDYV